MVELSVVLFLEHQTTATGMSEISIYSAAAAIPIPIKRARERLTHSIGNVGWLFGWWVGLV